MHRNLPGGIIRDPATGEFMSAQEAQFDDVEVVHANASIHVDGHTASASANEYANLTDFEGVLLMDFDQFLDRHRVGTVVGLSAYMVVHAYHGGSDRSTTAASVEFSSSPAKRVADIAPDSDLEDITDTDQVTGDLDSLEVFVETEDTFDVLTRPLVGASGAAFEDEGASAGGGSATGNLDRTDVALPGTEEFDRRDELFLNGSIATDGGFAASSYIIAGISLALGLSDA